MKKSVMAPSTSPVVEGELLTCQRIACDAKYTPDKNPEGCCIHHPSMPVFHDGTKEWPCCKQRSHDFGIFMSIPGCTAGQHTQEKPQKPIPTPSASATSLVNDAASSAAASPAKKPSGPPSCPRCKQGFFCSDHPDGGATVAGVMAQKPVKAAAVKTVGPDEVQTCKNTGCGNKFTERENHDKACSYHPGPPIFHERKKGWSCCDVHVWDFDEFCAIPPCKVGPHNAKAG